ncbi:unnamed protein product [Polarella glacialis]|uniref:Uncharacterized protein n=1 Tax=Polarella glacialis TaxID=89957 RepID=A0A813H7Z5_POLGL|nr:unnamed protein product [Polarella glacialis]
MTTFPMHADLAAAALDANMALGLMRAYVQNSFVVDDARDACMSDVLATACSVAMTRYQGPQRSSALEHPARSHLVPTLAAGEEYISIRAPHMLQSLDSRIWGVDSMLNGSQGSMFHVRLGD